jgi:hypothetical protein
MLRQVAVQALLGIATAGPLLSCPIEKIAHATREPLDRYKKTEISAREVHSLEGAVWQVYLRNDGALHSIVRLDFGEMGQMQTRASFVAADTFGIVVTTLKYDAPIDPNRRVRIAERSSTAFYFCDGSNVVYLPANPQEDASAPEAMRRAKWLRAMIFNSQEIAPYLKRVR